MGPVGVDMEGPDVPKIVPGLTRDPRFFGPSPSQHAPGLETRTE